MKIELELTDREIINIELSLLYFIEQLGSLDAVHAERAKDKFVKAVAKARLNA